MKKGIDYIGVSAGAMIINNRGELFLSKRSQSVKNERGWLDSMIGQKEIAPFGRYQAFEARK